MRDTILYISLVVNIVCLLGMVAGVLMHSGRGGGLSDMFGGAGSTALGSTAAERNLTRITTVFGTTTRCQSGLGSGHDRDQPL